MTSEHHISETFDRKFNLQEEQLTHGGQQGVEAGTKMATTYVDAASLMWAKAWAFRQIGSAFRRVSEVWLPIDFHAHLRISMAILQIID